MQKKKTNFIQVAQKYLNIIFLLQIIPIFLALCISFIIMKGIGHLTGAFIYTSMFLMCCSPPLSLLVFSIFSHNLDTNRTVSLKTRHRAFHIQPCWAFFDFDPQTS